MKTIYHTHFDRKGYGQWTIEIEFTSGEIFKIFTTDSEFYDIYSHTPAREKNELVANHFAFQIEEYFYELEN